MDDFQLRVLGEMAAVEVPWQNCRFAIVLLAKRIPVDDIEQRVLGFRDLAPSAEPMYPDGKWVAYVFSRTCKNLQEADNYFLLVSEMLWELRKEDRFDECIKVCEQAIDLAENSENYDLTDKQMHILEQSSARWLSSEKMQLSKLYRRKGDFQKAAKLLEGIRTADISVLGLPAVSKLGDERPPRKNPDSIGEIFTAAAELLPVSKEWTDENFNKAHEYFEAAFKRVQRRPPERPVLISHMFCEHVVDSYLRRQLFQEAHKWYRAAEQLVPWLEYRTDANQEFKEYENCRRWGAICAGLKQADEAQRSFLRAMEIAEERTKPVRLLGRVMNPLWLSLVIFDYALFLEENSRHQDALTVWQRLTEVPGGYDHLVEHGQIELRNKNPKNAVRCFEMSRQLFPSGDPEWQPLESLKVLSDFARAYREAGRFPESEKMYREALAIIERPKTAQEYFTVHPDVQVELYEQFAATLKGLDRNNELAEVEEKLQDLRGRYYGRGR